LAYTTKPIPKYTSYTDVFFKKGELEIDDNRFGFIDWVFKIYYLDLSEVKSPFYKLYGLDGINDVECQFIQCDEKHTNMIYYWNFIMTKEGSLFERERY